MFPTIKHLQKCPARRKDAGDKRIREILSSNVEFQEKGYVYVVTTEKFSQGKIICITSSRLKAQRKCFTKLVKKRKGYYTKYVKSKLLPSDLVREMSAEINQTK